MPTIRRTHRLRAMLAAVAALAAAAGARADLAAASPFLPSTGAAATGTDGPSGPIELRGIMAAEDGMTFCIYDTAKKKDVWVGLNEPGHAFVVRSSNPAADTIKVDYQGRTLNLMLHTPKVASAGPAGMGGRIDLRNPNQAINVVTSQSLNANPSPAEEQRRLDAVAQEVRRRRIEREKAAALQEGGALRPGQPPPAAPDR